MAAQQQQGERVVLRRGRRGGRRLEHCGGRFAATPGGLAAPRLGPPPGRHRDQPTGGVGRHPVGRPLPRRREQRLLDGVLALVETAEPPYEHAENPRGELPQQARDVRRHMSTLRWSSTGRTSISTKSASGMRAATWTARSMLSHSIR